jgi:hypothetical protein
VLTGRGSAFGAPAAAIVVFVVLVGGAARAGVAGPADMDAMMASMGTVTDGGCR